MAIRVADVVVVVVEGIQVAAFVVVVMATFWAAAVAVGKLWPLMKLVVVMAAGAVEGKVEMEDDDDIEALEKLLA